MRPILFDEDATTFTTNGEGRLDCISCKVTEERNGQYELVMQIAIDATHADQIKANSIIVVIPSDGASLQPFRVYRMTKPIDGSFFVYAHHISYQLTMIPSMPFSVTASSAACNNTLQALKNNAAEDCPFTFWTDVTTASAYKQDVPASIRSRLGGVEGSVLDQFGGEYEWDGYIVKLQAHRGVTVPNVSLRYGKNITDLEQEANIANTITGICPDWMSSDGSTLVTLPEKVVEGAYASQYPFKRTVPYDFSSKWEEAPTENELRTAAQAYVGSAGIGLPVVSIKVSFVALWQTEEYKEIAPLQRVKLCDLVNIEFEKFGINETAKVVKTVYDVLAEKYESIEIGSIRSNLGTTINDQNNATTTEINNKFSQVGAEIDNATAWLTNSGGYVMAVKNTDGSWKELLFLDTDDVDTAHNVLRINENGIGFSSNGVSGPYTQAWTLDGRLVIGGTNVPSITVYDNSQNIIFQASATSMIWNATNSSMNAQGVITTNGAQIRGGKIYQSDVYDDFSLTIEEGMMTLENNQGVIGTIGFYNVRPNDLTIRTVLGDLYLESNNDLLFKGDNLLVHVSGNQYAGGATDSLAPVTDIDYDTYTFATDLSITSDGQGGISWSYNNVTMAVATNHSTSYIEATKGIVTSIQ